MKLFALLLLAAPLAPSVPCEAAPEPSELAAWSARLEPRDARAGGGARLVVTAVVAPGWHLYSTTQPVGGSQRTSIALLPTSLKSLGPIAQPRPIKKRNPIFKITDELYQGAVSFGVPVVLDAKSRGPQRGEVQVRFQLCSDRLCSPLQTVRMPLRWTPQPGRARAWRRKAIAWVPAQPKPPKVLR